MNVKKAVSGGGPAMIPALGMVILPQNPSTGDGQIPGCTYRFILSGADPRIVPFLAGQPLTLTGCIAYWESGRFQGGTRRFMSR